MTWTSTRSGLPTNKSGGTEMKKKIGLALCILAAAVALFYFVLFITA